MDVAKNAQKPLASLAKFVMSVASTPSFGGIGNLADIPKKKFFASETFYVVAKPDLLKYPPLSPSGMGMGWGTPAPFLPGFSLFAANNQQKRLNGKLDAYYGWKNNGSATGKAPAHG